MAQVNANVPVRGPNDTFTGVVWMPRNHEYILHIRSGEDREDYRTKRRETGGERTARAITEEVMQTWRDLVGEEIRAKAIKDWIEETSEKYGWEKTPVQQRGRRDEDAQDDLTPEEW